MSGSHEPPEPDPGAREPGTDHGPDALETGTPRREFLKRAAVAGIGVSAAGTLLVDQASAHGRSPRNRRGGRHGGGGREPRDLESLPGESSLGGNISKVLFLTINVSDLDRAVEFYEKTYPVTRAEEVVAPKQDFRGLGIRNGSFRARMMRDNQPFQGGGILLVQWLDPAPVGTPYAEANHVGWYREHASASRTGMNQRYEDALAAGGRPYGPPSDIAIRDDLVIQSFAFRDPDGTTLEWVGPLQPNPDGPEDTVTGPNTNCRNLHRSYPWYKNVLGHEMQIRLNPSDPQPASNGSLGNTIRNPNGTVYDGLVDFDAAIMVVRGDPRNSVDLLEWQIPGSYGIPFRRANNLGMMSLTYEVNDIQIVYDKLRLLLSRREQRRYICAPPEEWDLGGFGVKKTLSVVDPDGTRFHFMERAHTDDPEP